MEIRPRFWKQPIPYYVCVCVFEGETYMCFEVRRTEEIGEKTPFISRHSTINSEGRGELLRDWVILDTSKKYINN